VVEFRRVFFDFFGINVMRAYRFDVTIVNESGEVGENCFHGANISNSEIMGYFYVNNYKNDEWVWAFIQGQ
jgi:hypothetical protein